MALQEIINKIKEEANQQAEEIKSQEDKKIQEIAAAGKKKIEEESSEIEKLTKKQSDKVIDRAKLESNIEERNKLVAVKQQLVNEVFTKALEYIANLSTEQQLLILTNLINQLPEAEDGEIMAASGRKEITQQALAQSNKNFTLQDKEFAGVGGFIFKSSKIEVNNSYEELLKGLREDLEIEISNQLFS